MFRAPSQAGLPGLDTLLRDLPGTPRQLARHMGISERTLRRYQADNQAPRAVMLALFWETRWGRSAADTEAANFGAIYYRQAQGLERQNAALRRRIEALERELDAADKLAANAPFFSAAAG